VLAAAAVLAGCGSSSGPSEAEGLASYYIEGYYCHFPREARELDWASCLVYVRYGGPSGDPVSGLAVTCNGEPLDYVTPSYSADIDDIEPGEDVTFEVSDGRRSVSVTLVVPEGPTGLGLSEGAWDFSSPIGTHTLTWTNPVATADSVLVSVGGRGSHPLDVHVHLARAPSSATELTLTNADMDDFGSTHQISCAVAQEVRSSFPGHQGGSRMWARAAVVREWER
jgi:hypothetical protein